MASERTLLELVSGYAPTAGTRLYWEEAGTGEPLVLLHAGIADRRMWDAQMAAFAPHFRVIRFDTRGFGRSELGTGPFSYRADVISLLDARGIDRAHLIGVSFGGSVALDVALDYPDRIRSLVIGASSPRGIIDHAELHPLWEEVDALVEAGKIDEANELEARMWVDGPIRSPETVDPAIRERMLEMNRPLLAAASELEEIEIDPPVAERLDQLQMPVLVLAGEYDQPSSIAGPKLLADRIPHAEFQMLHGAAHLLNMEQPDAFNELVLGFLQRQQAKT